MAKQPLAQPIIAGINDNGGLTPDQGPPLELRFAYALLRASISPHCEIPGEGEIVNAAE
jgi:hypothetical protein